MLIRDCAGGVIFYNDTVFLIMNEKNEWVMPKGLIKDGESPQDAAVRRVFEETDIKGSIVEQAGRTYYEFYSVTGRYCNRIAWILCRLTATVFRFLSRTDIKMAVFLIYPRRLT